MMTNEVQSAIATDAALTAQSASAAPVSTIPQVGDVVRGGVVVGVRTYAAGGCDISFNGVDWASYGG